MCEIELKNWQSHNAVLQRAYQEYLGTSIQKIKDVALQKIIIELEWEPFRNYCFKFSAPIYSITKYGLDYITEKCISDIDLIAKGEKDY